jgi:hypothetical protein
MMLAVPISSRSTIPLLCVKSINELEPVTLSKLVMGSRHRGEFLLVAFLGDGGSGRTKTALVDIQGWIADTTTTCPNVERSVRSVPDLLRSPGFGVDAHEGVIKSISPKTNSIMTGIAKVIWSPLISQALVHHAHGRTQAEQCLTGFVRALDRILNGHDAETDRVFNAYSKLPAQHPARVMMEASAS